MNPRALPADRLFAAYNAVLAVVWCTVPAGEAWAPAMAALHAAGATLPWLLARLPERLPPAVRCLREGYPMLLLLPTWAELGWLAAVRQLPTHDGAIAALDRTVFGTHYHLAWRRAAPGLAEVMFLFYVLYYLTIFVPPVVLALRRRLDAYRDFSFRVLVAFLGCYVCYLAFPVIGPRALAGHHAPAGGALELLSETLHATGDSPGTAFPSSHVTGTVTIAWLAWRWLPRPAAWLLTALAAAVAVAAIYTGNHFTVDVVAGLVWVAILQILVAPWFERRIPGAPAVVSSAAGSLLGRRAKALPREGGAT